MKLHASRTRFVLALVLIIGLSPDMNAQGRGGTEPVADRGLGEAQRRQQFAKFDAVYIPALALTNKQELAKSKQALQRLTRQWPTFEQRWRAAFDDRQWADDLERCDRAIAKASELLDDSQLSAAHEALEPIRDILMRARRRNGLDYPLDAISDFHGTMEQIVKPAMKMAADDLSPAHLQKLKQLCTEADQKWSVVERTSFDDPALALTNEKRAAIKEAVGAERQALKRLEAAQQSGDRQAVLQAARSIKPAFAKLYMLFGDFSGGAPGDSASNDGAAKR